MLDAKFIRENIEVVKMICSIIDEKLGIKNRDNLIKFVEDRPGHDRRYAIDASKINSSSHPLNEK